MYAGSSVSTYFLSQLCTNPGFIELFTGGYQVGNYPEMMGNNLDFLATRVAYKLNLRGPGLHDSGGVFNFITRCYASLPISAHLPVRHDSSRG